MYVVILIAHYNNTTSIKKRNLKIVLATMPTTTYLYEIGYF